MPDYDKIVNEMSPDDAASLFAENGMSDQPMAQQIVRKLKGAQTRQRIAAATADGKPIFDTPDSDSSTVLGTAKQVGRAIVSVPKELGSAIVNTGGQTVKGLSTPVNRYRGRQLEAQDSLHNPSDETDPLLNDIYAGDVNSNAANRETHRDIADAVADTQLPINSAVARGVGSIVPYMTPLAPVVIAGSAGNRFQDAKEHGASDFGAAGAGVADAALNTLIPAGLGRLAKAGAGLRTAGMGVAGGEAMHVANAGITATYDTDAAKAQLLDPVNIALAGAPGAIHGAAAVGEHANNFIADSRRQGDIARANEAAAHAADLQAQDKAKEVQQGIQNAQLVPTQQMRTGPDGQLAPSKAIVPGGPGASVDLAPKTENLTDQTRITSGEASGKSKPPANGQPADMSVEPHEMPPISDINAIYGTRSGKSKPPANGRTVDMSVEGDPTPFDLPPAAHQIVVDAKLSPQETIQLAKGMEGWDAHADPAGAAANVDSAIKAMRERAASKADKQQATQGAPDVIPQELRQEPQQGVQPVGVEARSNQADGRRNAGQGAGIEEAQGRRGNETSEQSSQKQGLGPVREGKSQKGLAHLSEPAREYVAKQTPEMQAALAESVDHFKQHPDPQGDLGNLQMVMQGLEHRAAKNAKATALPPFEDTPVLPVRLGPIDVYHGTSRAGFKEFDPYGGEYGLMGDGIYTTENKAVAREYMTKGKGDSHGVYSAKVHIKNPLDMDAHADRAKWQKAADDHGLEGVDFNHAKTNEDAYRVLEDHLSDGFTSKSEGRETAQSIVESMGHDGITHIGGSRVNPNGTKHRVWIPFHPEAMTDVRLVESHTKDVAQGLGPVREGKSQKGLDAALGKAQPRYNFGEKSFTPEFESSADKAAYIIASRTPGSSKSVAHDKIVRAAEAAGHDIEQLHARGLEIRNEIKSQARDAESGAPIHIAPKQQSNTRGGFINLGDIVDHTMKIARFISSHIANDSVLVDLERRASGMARAVTHFAEGVHADFAKLVPSMKDAVNRYMDGDRSTVLPPEWKAKIDKFRMKQDQLSAWAAAQLNKAADHLDLRAGASLLSDKAVELKKLAQTMRDHAATFTSNIGSYLNRQYAIHTQGIEWINKVRNTPAYNDAITESMQRNPNLSQDQARVQIEDLMSEQIPDALAPIKGNGSVTGALNERNDLSPVIRKLFGEVTDPGERAAISLMKTSQLLENMKVQNGIADAAQHFGLLNEMPEHGAENYVHLSSVGSLKNSPIGGMYAPKDVARQLVGINAQTNATLRLLAKMSVGTNVAATVGNMAASVPRQIIANVPLAFSSGYLTPGNIGAALKMASRALTDEVYKEHLMSLNVIDQGMTRSQLGAQIAHMKGVQNGLVQMDNGLKRGLRTAHQAFSIPDDLLRGLSFASELRRAEKRGMVGAEAEHWASNRMGDSTPDWAKAWKLPKTISTYAPGIGQFATMAAEMTRIQLKQIQHTAEAWQSGQHAEAIMRTVGLATTMAASYGMAQYFMNKHAGVSPEEDTAVRSSQATPDYMKSHVLQYGDKDASGKRTIRDLSSMNPYYPIAEPIKFIADGKPLAALAQAISPYLGVSIFGQRVGEAISGSKLNMQGDSEALSKPDAGPIEQVKDRALHVAAGFEPATERKFRTGQPYSVFPNTEFTPDRAARQDVKQVSQTYDAYVKDVYKEAAKRGDGALTDQEAKQISDLQNKRDSDLTTTGKQITDYSGSSNSTLGAERANKIRAVDIVHPGDNSPELIKARYRLGSVEKALSTFETFKQLSNDDPAKAKFFAENQDVIRASASAYDRYTDAKRLLNIAEVHPENPELIRKAMSLLK